MIGAGIIPGLANSCGLVAGVSTRLSNDHHKTPKFQNIDLILANAFRQSDRRDFETQIKSTSN